MTTTTPANNPLEEEFGETGSAIWIVTYSFVIIVTIFGNCLTIVAIIWSRQLSSIISNKFILSLAYSDLFVGLSIPYHMCFYLYDDFGQTKNVCILRFIFVAFACSSSICKLLNIAFDRFIAILHPLHYTRYMTKKVSLLLVLVTWVISLSLATIPIYWNNWSEGVQCKTELILPANYFNFVLTPLFSLVWGAMLVLYVKIWRETRDHVERIRSATFSKSTARGISDSKSMNVVMLTLGCFSICWMPYFIVTTYYRITNTSSRYSLVYEIAFTLAVSNSGMNPVIYAWKNSNFREAFWCLLTCRSPNSVIKKSSYITNHVPSKKSSMANGTLRGQENVLAESEIDIEMNCNNVIHKEYDEHECSVNTEMTIVNTSDDALPKNDV